MLGIKTYPHLVLIANSDPLIVALLPGGDRRHLCGRIRLGVRGARAGLAGPAGGVGVRRAATALWGSGRSPRAGCARWRWPASLLIPAFWFSVPALTSQSWFISGDLALNQQTVIHGYKIVGVVSRLRSLYELPMQLAVSCGVAVAVVAARPATLLVVARGGAVGARSRSPSPSTAGRR